MDSYKRGQWVIFPVSDRSTSAYQLSQKLMQVMAVRPSQEVRDNMSNMSVMFRTSVGLFVDASSSRITYNEFLAELKTAYSVVVLKLNLFGIHMPVMFRTTVGLFVDASSSRITFNEFLAELKTVQGMGLHSLQTV